MVDGIGVNGVCLIGDAPAEVEARIGKPFKGPAGFRLERLVQMLGQRRDDFLLTNVCWHQPFKNREPSEAEIAQWRPQWELQLRDSRIAVVVPLGNAALRAVLGLDGILGKRGYLYWSEAYGKWVLPTVHPSFILRGNANWSAAWLRDVTQALDVGQNGPPKAPKRELTLDPHPDQAHWWASLWERAGCPPLSFDIETPDKGTSEEEAEIRSGDLQAQINRIGFAWRGGAVTHACSIPWGANYLSVVQALFSRATTPVVWNRHFDVPRLRAHGVSTAHCHDAQEMWHVLHSDLPKRLEFVTPFLSPAQYAWKHLNWEQPALYNCLDAALTIEHFDALYGEPVVGTEPMEKFPYAAFEATGPSYIRDEDLPF